MRKVHEDGLWGEGASAGGVGGDESSNLGVKMGMEWTSNSMMYLVIALNSNVYVPLVLCIGLMLHYVHEHPLCMGGRPFMGIENNQLTITNLDFVADVIDGLFKEFAFAFSNNYRKSNSSDNDTIKVFIFYQPSCGMRLFLRHPRVHITPYPISSLVHPNGSYPSKRLPTNRQHQR